MLYGTTWVCLSESSTPTVIATLSCRRRKCPENPSIGGFAATWLLRVSFRSASPTQTAPSTSRLRGRCPKRQRPPGGGLASLRPKPTGEYPKSRPTCSTSQGVAAPAPPVGAIEAALRSRARFRRSSHGVYVSAVTESSRWPTNSPILAHGMPRRCSRLMRRCRRSWGDQSGMPAAAHAFAMEVRSASAPDGAKMPRRTVAILPRADLRLDGVCEDVGQVHPEYPDHPCSPPHGAAHGVWARRSRSRASRRCWRRALRSSRARAAPGGAGGAAGGRRPRRARRLAVRARRAPHGEA